MKVVNTGLIQFLSKAGCFEIPYYQRAYSWSQKQWQQLFDDIVSLSRYENMKKHFLGTIVYESNNLAQISMTSKVKLIDGQQRLVTISLLLVALKNHVENAAEKNLTLAKKIRNNLLINPNEEGDLRHKILLNNEDRDIYTLLIQGIDDISAKSPVFEAYSFFKEQIASSGINPQDLFSTLMKLEIIDMALEKDIDNAQLIFDSLNSTGIALSQIDQIRNFVLLGLSDKEQKSIYETCWKPIELSFENMDYKEKIEDFLRDYLTIQNNGKIPPKTELYEEFNKFYMEKLKYQNRETIIRHILKYSKYYIKLLSGNIMDSDVRRHIQTINDESAKDAYPFLMEVFEDYECELIDKEILLEILTTVVHFVTKRDGLAQPEKTFATLSNDINQMLSLKNFTPKIIKDSKKSTINEIMDEIDDEISA